MSALYIFAFNHHQVAAAAYKNIYPDLLPSHVDIPGNPGTSQSPAVPRPLGTDSLAQCSRGGLRQCHRSAVGLPC